MNFEPPSTHNHRLYIKPKSASKDYVFEQLVNASAMSSADKKDALSFDKLEEKFESQDTTIHDPLMDDPDQLINYVHVPTSDNPNPPLGLTARGLLQRHMRMRSKMRRNTARKGKRAKHGRSSAPSLPPNLNTTMCVNHTFRFATSATVNNSNITVGNLFGICGCVCSVTNTTVVSIASGIRVHKVTIWPALSTTAAIYPEVVWQGGLDIKKDKSMNDQLPSGVTVEKVLHSTPPKNTLVGEWYDGSLNATTMFTLNSCLAGTIIDVNLSFTIKNNLGGVSITIATGTLGNFYYLHLDGAGTHLCVPMGVPSTF